ncbi:MAG: diphthine--ammonia ligase, partial [archaeon]
MRLAVLFSGGKDSVLAAHLAQQAGHEVACLVAIESKNKDSFMYHTPNISITALQAESMNLPLITIYTTGKKESEVTDLEKGLRILVSKMRLEGLVTGAIHSSYQATRIQKVCHALRIECLNPLWLSPPLAHWHELLAKKFEIMLVRVAANGLDKNWLGRIITENNLHSLAALSHAPYWVHPAGEGGEFESLVLDAPLFEKKIHVEKIS